MKPQYDVNDNGQSIYEDPKQSYKELDNTGNANPALVRKNQTTIKSTIHIILLVFVFILLIFILAFCVKNNDTKKLDEEKFYSTNSTSINTYNVDMNITNYIIEDNVAKVDIEIKNNSENDVYITAKGIYLSSDTSVYCTNIIQSNLNSKFYGQAIMPKETIKATLIYENISDNPNRLIITNIIDTEHLSWTNAIALKNN